MQHEDTSSQGFAGRKSVLPGMVGGFPRLLGSLVLAGHLVGCSSTGLPSAGEQAEVGAGAKAVVLLRVQCAIEGGRPYEPFGFSMVDDNVSFSLGSFETGGEPRQTGMLRFLSPESRRDGWTYLILPHGTHYLVVSPPRRTDVFTFEGMMKRAPRFRIDVPVRAKLVYVGTLRLEGESDWLLTGGRIMKSIRADETRIVNEQALARQLAAGHFPGAGELQTALMRRHEGPVILSSPVP